MKINDLMNKTLKELLDEYCILYNGECGYYYGVARFDDANQLLDEYNVEEEYPEALWVENLISDEVILSGDDEILSYEVLEKIATEHLGVTKKE